MLQCILLISSIPLVPIAANTHPPLLLLLWLALGGVE